MIPAFSFGIHFTIVLLHSFVHRIFQCWNNLPCAQEHITTNATHTHTHTQTQPFNGLWSGTTRVGRYQEKHSPTHTHPVQLTSFINFLHVLRSIASSLFNLSWTNVMTNVTHTQLTAEAIVLQITHSKPVTDRFKCDTAHVPCLWNVGFVLTFAVR